MRTMMPILERTMAAARTRQSEMGVFFQSERDEKKVETNPVPVELDHFSGYSLRLW